MPEQDQDVTDPPEYVSACCAAPRHPDFETDICSECRDHAEFVAPEDA